MNYIAIMFLAAQFQCGASAELAEFQVKATVNSVDYFITLGEEVVIQAEPEQLTGFEILPLENASCINFDEDIFLMQLASVEEIPLVEAVYNQVDIDEYFVDLKESEEIIIGEFGCGNTLVGCTSADWQDSIIRVDYNHTTLYAD